MSTITVVELVVNSIYNEIQKGNRDRLNKLHIENGRYMFQFSSFITLKPWNGTRGTNKTYLHNITGIKQAEGVENRQHC
jgi:hypothetical protein